MIIALHQPMFEKLFLVVSACAWLDEPLFEELLALKKVIFHSFVSADFLDGGAGVRHRSVLSRAVETLFRS